MLLLFSPSLKFPCFCFSLRGFCEGISHVKIKISGWQTQLVVHRGEAVVAAQGDFFHVPNITIIASLRNHFELLTVENCFSISRGMRLSWWGCETLHSVFVYRGCDWDSSRDWASCLETQCGLGQSGRLPLYSFADFLWYIKWRREALLLSSYHVEANYCYLSSYNN